MTIRSALKSDVARMLEIYRPAILDSAISFETEVPSLLEFENRWKEYSWLVFEIDGSVAGYAYAQ